MEVTRIDEGMYKVAFSHKRVFIVITRSSRDNNRNRTAEGKRVLEDLTAKTPLPSHWGLRLLAPSSKLRLKFEFPKVLREAGDGCIIGIFCKSEGIHALAVRLLEASASIR